MGPVTFKSLPYELREKIYKLSLSLRHTVVINHDLRTIHDMKVLSLDDFSLNLLDQSVVGAQIAGEARDIFFQQTTLNLTPRQIPSALGSDWNSLVCCRLSASVNTYDIKLAIRDLIIKYHAAPNMWTDELPEMRQVVKVRKMEKLRLVQLSNLRLTNDIKPLWQGGQIAVGKN
ncbi:uncharacterized protein KY384_003514 [Bacidia gigantensis]|uniref:uncharacterized protein n=1 Tax=Bacidia gigantensis TaxID=2732470 RepID=UPI001D0390C7|nr:uncharacterized protein KY384_003514 [Bacidia gigantensis]KAG8531878.1 hypothetical protein KY384_003514 [Bacidia gigantensis]